MPRILIVDDEPDLLLVLGRILSAKGYMTAEVAQSKLVAQVLESSPFDLMITDLRMEPVNGLELVKLAAEHYPRMPVVVMTAYHTEQIVQECLDTGAVEVLSKPFDFDHLMHVVEQAIARKTPC